MPNGLALVEPERRASPILKFRQHRRRVLIPFRIASGPVRADAIEALIARPVIPERVLPSLGLCVLKNMAVDPIDQLKP